MKVVIIRNNCNSCGTKWSQFGVDKPNPIVIKESIELQKKHIESLHPGHTYKLKTKVI